MSQITITRGERAVITITPRSASPVVITHREPRSIVIRRPGVSGQPGTAATISVGTVSAVGPSDPATVTNVGTTSAAIFDFEIPVGEDGDAATVAVGTVTTVAAGQPATVTNVGTATAAILDFEIPEGDAGDDGADGVVAAVVAGTGIDVDATDPANPEVALDSASQASLALADTSLQPSDFPTIAPGDAGKVLTVNVTEDGYDLEVPAGGDVDSVNGQTGVVVLDADDIDDTATTNKFTTAGDISKLAAIEASADVTDADNVGASIHGASAKTTPVDADTVPLIDSEASNVLKKLSWANLKATLKTYFDTLYNLGYIAGGTDVAVADGGTGRGSHTAYAVLCGGTTSTAAQQSIAGLGASGQVLTSNGAGALPTFQNAPGGSGITYLTGSATWDPSFVTETGPRETNVTVTGAALGDFAMASFSLDLPSQTGAIVEMSAHVSAADTVTVVMSDADTSSGGPDPSSGTVRVVVFPKSQFGL